MPLIPLNEEKLRKGDRVEWEKFHSAGAQADRAYASLVRIRKSIKKYPHDPVLRYLLNFFQARYVSKKREYEKSLKENNE